MNCRILAYYVKDPQGIVRCRDNGHLSCAQPGHSQCHHKAAVQRFIANGNCGDAGGHIDSSVATDAEDVGVEAMRVKEDLEAFKSKSRIDNTSLRSLDYKYLFHFIFRAAFATKAAFGPDAVFEVQYV